MPNITEMNPTEFRELLHTLVNEELFKSRERLAALLAKDSPQEALEAEFFHFHGDYVDFAFWLERLRGRPSGRAHTRYTACQKTQTATRICPR